MIINENIKRDKSIDNSLAILHDGYKFIQNKANLYQSDLIETHFLGQKVICMSGKQAAELFYDPELFQRNGALTKRLIKLFGENAVQTIDGDEHLCRKSLFISLTSPLHEKRLADMATEQWESSIDRLENYKQVVLFDEAKQVLCLVACKWAGIPLNRLEVRDRAEDLNSIVNAFFAVGPRYWKGKAARARLEKWLSGVVQDVRSGRLEAKSDSALNSIAFYQDIDGCQLGGVLAAAELINLLRPIVAISTFITFAALALYDHPEYRDELTSDGKLEMFSQEVRRYYPLAPFVGAKVRKNFVLNNYQFQRGTLALLDIYGTNHDAQIWIDPDQFVPERFSQWKGNMFGFIPHGGGDSSITHRCPGEGITIEIMKTSLDFLVNKIEFEVPEQDLNYSLSKIPTLPESGFIMSNIKRRLLN